jgi:hypothetical protein
MNLSRYIILMVIGTYSLNSHALKKSRKVYANDKEIKSIYLTLGRSTVLTFNDKPVKVVVGNKNYYNVEYINNHVAIQPLGTVDTNLFVYTENKRTYALHLKMVSPAHYDDIAHVHWKSSYSFKPKKKKRAKESLIKLPLITLDLKKQLLVDVTRLSKLDGGSYFIQLHITNKTQIEIEANKIEITLTRKGKKLAKQRLFFKDEKIKEKSRTQARIFLKLKQKSGFTINVKFKDKARKAIIGRKYL